MPAPNGLRTTLSRGFSSLKAPGIFTALAEKAKAEQFKKSPPKTIMDVYDLLPISVAQRANIDAIHKPSFLAPVMKKLDVAMKEEVKFCLHTPPRHGKTLMIHCAFVFYHLTTPGRIHMYLTYNQGKADKERRDFCALLMEMRIEHKVWNDEVLLNGGANEGGTTILFRGVTRATAGHTVSGIVFVDDAIASDEKALSPKQRDKLWSVILDVNTRKMGRLSMIVVMTRWNKDDIVGRLIAQHQWEYVCLPALTRNHLGELVGLWDRYDVNYYLQLREGQSEKTWAAKYQGDPFPEGDRFFNTGIPIYDTLPVKPLQWSIGMDAGYTGGGGDWSVASVLARDPETGTIYIVKVVRRMVRFDLFVADIQLLVFEFPGATLTWLYGGQERGLADVITSQNLMKNKLPNIKLIPSDGKLNNAYSFQEAWNSGNVVAPKEQSPMVKSFVTNITDFTGFNDAHDDDMDAMASAMRGFSGVAKVMHRPLPIKSINRSQSTLQRKQLSKGRLRLS